ncbi:hypothetical protein COD17_08600 [Bacillus thuringiensis]|nr:hypothetical protein COD17_08600 [Bacillus thuringiensis]
MRIEDFEYEIGVNESGEIVLHFKVDGKPHTLGVTERDAKAFAHIFQLSKGDKGNGTKTSV